MSKTESEKLVRLTAKILGGGAIAEPIGYSWWVVRGDTVVSDPPDRPTPEFIFGTEADSGSDGLLELSAERFPIIVKPCSTLGVGPHYHKGKWVAYEQDTFYFRSHADTPTLAAYRALLKAWDIK